MTELNALPASQAPYLFDQQLFFGTPELATLPDRLAQARRTVIVEPDPDQVNAISQTLGTRPNLQVLNAGVGVAADGQVLATATRELVTYNAPGLASLNAPTGILALFPGLRARTRHQVRLYDPVALLQQLGTRRGSLAVFIRTLGEEQAILDALARSGTLAAVRQITVFCGAEPLFDKAADLAFVESWAAMQGWKVLPQPEDGDPDLLNLHLVPLAPAQEVQVALEASLEGPAAPPDLAPPASQGADISGLEERLRSVIEDQSKGRIAELETLLEQAQEARKLVEANHQKAMADLSMSLQLQSMLRMDLAELQARFAVSERIRQEQETLLRKLTPRLQEAALQLQQLSIAGRPTGEVAIARTQAARKRRRKTMPPIQVTDGTSE